MHELYSLIHRESNIQTVFFYLNKYKSNIPPCCRDPVALKQISLWIYKPADTKCKQQQV